MLKKILHQIVAIPFVYDLLQTAVGARFIRNRLHQRLLSISKQELVLDIGGGTGLNRSLFAPNTHYICLDNDSIKLQGFLQKQIDGDAILGDAGKMPMPSNSMDVVICTAVIHHLPDDIFPKFVQESLRILKPTGQLVILDPVWASKRLIGRLLWQYDRGSFPRTAQVLHDTLSRYGQEVHWEEFAVLHRYIIGIFKKNEVA